MLAIVTGATGFIGGYLTAVLAAGGDVEIVSVGRRQPAQGIAIQADLGERGWTRRLPIKADVVFHLAQSSRYRDFPLGVEDVRAINVDATMELAEWASRAGVRRMIFASTGNVYGDTPTPADETQPTQAHTMYAASKLAAEVLLRPFSSLFEVLVTRLFGVYGPGQQGTLFPQMIKRVRQGDEITLARGIGVRVNPLYIEDCARILASLSRAPQPTAYEVVNVGGDQVVTLAEVVGTIESLLGRKARIRTTDEQPTSLIGNVKKLASLVPIGALVPLRQGLIRTIDGSKERT